MIALLAIALVSGTILGARALGASESLVGPIALIPAALVILWAPVASYIRSRRYGVLYLRERHQSFLQRNRDAFVVGVIAASLGSVIGAVIGSLITWLLTRN